MPNDAAPLARLATPAARVRAALAGTRFADVRAVRETASTNDDAAALLGDPSAAGATLVAEFQTAGRGRKAGRSWIAPAGSALLVHHDPAGAGRHGRVVGRAVLGRAGRRRRRRRGLRRAAGPALAQRPRPRRRAKPPASCARRALRAPRRTSRAASASTCAARPTPARRGDRAAARISVGRRAARRARSGARRHPRRDGRAARRPRPPRARSRARGKSAPGCAAAPTGCGSTRTAASSRAPRSGWTAKAGS